MPTKAAALYKVACYFQPVKLHPAATTTAPATATVYCCCRHCHHRHPQLLLPPTLLTATVNCRLLPTLPLLPLSAVALHQDCPPPLLPGGQRVLLAPCNNNNDDNDNDDKDDLVRFANNVSFALFYLWG
jgi:hypothetical protein